MTAPTATPAPTIAPTAPARATVPQHPDTSTRVVLRLSPADEDQLRVEARGPAGSVTTVVAAPAIEPQRAPREIGARLFAVAFSATVLRFLDECSLRLDGDAPLPILLDPVDPTLAALPWELAYDPDAERFLAQSPTRPLSRIAPVVPRRLDLRAPLRARRARRGRDLPAALTARGVHSHLPSVPAPLRTRLLIAEGDAATATAVLRETRVPAVLALPPAMSAEARSRFLDRLAGAIDGALGIAAAVAIARGALAAESDGTDWAQPVLVERPHQPRSVVKQLELARTRAATETVDWVKSTLSGIVSSLVLFVVGLILFRLGYGESPSLEINIISPYSLYTSFKALMVELSTFQEHILLVVTGLFAVATGLAVVVWRRRREPGGGVLDQLVAPIARPRAIVLLGIATLTVAGSYLYQLYLWNVSLPVPAHTFGIALTREAGTASFRAALDAALSRDGGDRPVVVRELPVSFTASDVDRAREIGERIDAEATVIYRVDEAADGGADRYVAYLAFVDPRVGGAVGAVAPPADDTIAAIADRTPLLRIKDGPEVPALRTSSLDQLVDAVAGIIAYHDDRPQTAIGHLERALGADPEGPSAALLGSYLGQALALVSHDERAVAAFEQSAAAFEARLDAGEDLGPADQLVLLQTYLGRAELALTGGDWAGADPWLRRGVDLRDDLLARAASLERPADVPAAFVRIYHALAEEARVAGNSEDERFWRTRATDELATFAKQAGDDPVTLVQLGATQLVLGDCFAAGDTVERVLALAPNEPAAIALAANLAVVQGRADLARPAWERLVAARPTAVDAQRQLADLTFSQGIAAGAFADPATLARAEGGYREVIRLDPANLAAHQALASLAALRLEAARVDLTALLSGDERTRDKRTATFAADAERRRAAQTVADDLVAVRTTISDLLPGDPVATNDLAAALVTRMEVNLAASETGAETSGDPLGIDAGGAQVIALTDAVLADASTDRLQRLRAWERRLDALLAQHQWASAVAPDGGADPALLDQLRQAAASATAELDAAAVAPGAEANAAAAIATATARIATITGDDPAPAERRAAAFAAQGVAGESETAGPQPVCREARHYQTGIARSATGDFDGARVAFEAALAVNPEHLPSAIELSWTLVRLGDPAAATTRIEATLKLAPNDARSWGLLSLYRLDSGEIDGGTEALDRFAQLLGGEVSQRRLALLTTMIGEWQRLVDADQGRAADVRAMLPPATRTVATLPAEDVRSPQAALVMAALGGLALDVDDPATAEPLLRRALELDPRLPVARAHLALAVTAGDGDPTVEIEAATAELTDPLWAEIGESPATIAEEMRRAVAAYIDGNAGREEHAQPLLDALDDA